MAARANKIVGLLRRNTDNLDAETVLFIYWAIIIPILEYAVQTLCPYLQKNIDELEKVQHRVTKLVPGLSDLCYEERCKRLELLTLKSD